MTDDSTPMSDARLAEIRTALHGVVDVPPDARGAIRAWQDAAFRFAQYTDELLADNDRRRAREAALMAEHEQAMAVVRAVAKADNSDNSVCYQVCDYSMHGNWMIEHEAPCVVKQARAVLAATKPTDATTAE